MTGQQIITVSYITAAAAATTERLMSTLPYYFTPSPSTAKPTGIGT